MAEEPRRERYVTEREFGLFREGIERDLREINRRLGIHDALQSLADVAPELRNLTQVLRPELLTRVVELAEAKADDEAFWRGLRRRLNPLKPLGFAVWALLLALVSGSGRALYHLLTGQ